MQSPRLRLVLAMALSATALAAISIVAVRPAATADAGIASRTAFHDASRKLWEDHITWTRCFIVSAATLPTDLPDRGATTDRLLQNQVDIGNVIRAFYGEQPGDDVTALLTEHILLAAQIIDAAKAGDTAAQEQAIDDWYANAEAIAVYLNGLNPKNWSVGELTMLLTSHLDLTLEEAVDRLQGRYAEDVDDYDAVHNQILSLSDTLSNGIIAQFPSQFGR